MSQHRRRSSRKRRTARRSGYLLPATAMAITAIMGTTLAGTWALREHSGAGAAIAAALQPAGRAVAVLEQQRQQLIVMDAAAHTMHLVGSPKVASKPTPAATSQQVYFPPPDPGSAKSIAYNMMPSFGFDPGTQFGCLDNVWTRESGWRYNAENASGAYGIPQALPGSKMSTAGADWQTNPATQIKWGLGYIKAVYGTPCNAWAFWQAHSYY